MARLVKVSSRKVFKRVSMLVLKQGLGKLLTPRCSLNLVTSTCLRGLMTPQVVGNAPQGWRTPDAIGDLEIDWIGEDKYSKRQKPSPKASECPVTAYSKYLYYKKDLY